MRSARYHESHFIDFYTQVLDSLFKEICNTIDEYKKLLPEKAKRPHIPHVLWIAPPTHKFFKTMSNEDRSRFQSCLINAVKPYKSMTVLKMVKFWDSDNEQLFHRSSYRFSSEGLKNYWLSIDSAIRFWYVALSRKIETTKKLMSAPKKGEDNRKRQDNRPKMGPSRFTNDRYKWFNPRTYFRTVFIVITTDVDGYTSLTSVNCINLLGICVNVLCNCIVNYANFIL